MIEVKNLTKKYGTNVAVSDLSFKVESGQVYGFLGPNGAGKSTTMNIITGCLAATEGQILINGYDIFEQPMEAKKCIGYLPEIPPVYTEMTPYEYLSFVGMAKGLKKKELNESIEKIAEVTGITDVLKRLIKNLSKGYRQRVGIAQALIGNPEIIILDEPTVGLDPIQIIEIRDLIKELGKDHTVILSSHILSEVSAICDEILIISKGQLVACDTPENLSKRFSDDAVIELQVKGFVDKVKEALENIEGIKKLEVKHINTDGTVTVEVTSSAEDDLREKIFYAMQKAECAVLTMNLRKATLEDIFLKLTSGEVPEDIMHTVEKKLEADEKEEDKE